MGAVGGKGAPAPPTFGVDAQRGINRGMAAAANRLGNDDPMSSAAARDQATQAAYGQMTSRLDPMWEQREQGLTASIANQGLDPGSAAATRMQGDFGRQRNDAYSTAMANAMTGAGNTAFAQQMAAQNQPYQQMGMLTGLQNQQYQNQLNAYGIEQAGKNGLLGGAAGLGGTLGGASILAASDERLKTNIVRGMLEAIPGVRFASWEWIDGPPGRHHGVIAPGNEHAHRLRALAWKNKCKCHINP